MAEQIYEFPCGFLWGTATSSHQVEGGNTNNNWHLWEQQPGRILDGERAGLACDWWGGRWQEDFDRAADAGQNSHRFSIEWSRVQPEPGRWDEDALDVYRQMAHGAVARGLTPIVTLHHFTDPIWLTEMGGWEHESAPEHFEVYVRRVVAALGDYVNVWCTINEPNVLATIGYLVGDFPPGVSDLGRAFSVMEMLVRGHARAYHAIHELQPEARAAMVISYRGMRPARPWWPLDQVVTRAHHQLFNDFFPRALQDGKLRYIWRSTRVPEAAGTQDFLAINYYTSDLVAFSFRSSEAFGQRFFPPEADLSPNAFIANEPEAFYRALHWAASFGLPVLVTENGVEDATDELRPRYLTQHLYQLWRAIQDGVPIKGYWHWSLVDNFEWERAWQQRFGLWELDRGTQERRARPSAKLYEEICKANALSSARLAEFDLANQQPK